MTIRAVVFDFGGVLAEEGFQAGLQAIARQSGLDPAAFFAAAMEAVYASGYVTGRCPEAGFWQALRQDWELVAADHQLRREILERFVVRPWMLGIVRALKEKGCRTAILSDQSDWLDELDRRDDFFREFELVLNSYHLGISKRDAVIFDEAVRALGLSAAEVLLVDDNPGHIQRAAARGLVTHLFRGRPGFLAALQGYGLV